MEPTQRKERAYVVTMDAKGQKNLSESRRNSKRSRRNSPRVELVKHNGAQAEGKVVVLDGGVGDGATTRPPRRRSPAAKQDKELAKLDELFLLAWKETYESRKRKLV